MARASTPPMTLARLPVSETAVLTRVGGHGSYRRRLLELGFLPGTEVTVVRRVGIGDVLEVELRGSRISLRISEAESLSVQPRGRAS